MGRLLFFSVYIQNIKPAPEKLHFFELYIFREFSNLPPISPIL